MKVLEKQLDLGLRNLARANIGWFEAFFLFLCAVYWSYLTTASAMLISADAGNFELLGKGLYEKGWIDYFVHGPQKEPMYPFLISLAMRVAGLLNINYQKVQMVIQFLFLFISQLFVLTILKRLNINRALRIATGLYIGISPALPFQYALLYVIEGLRTFFWETSRLGFVNYPSRLQTVYSNNVFNDMLRLAVFLISMFAFFFVAFQLMKKFLIDAHVDPVINDRNLFLFFVITMIISHVAIYALTNIVTRYSLHVAPLFLICIALTFDSLLTSVRRTSSMKGTARSFSYQGLC